MFQQCLKLDYSEYNSCSTIVGKSFTSEEKFYKIMVSIYLFFVGFRISLIAVDVQTVFFLSGILMSMSIVYVFESDHLYKAETLVVLFWLYFSHACLMLANSFFIFGLACIITILNRFEKRYSKDGKTKTLPLVLLFVAIGNKSNFILFVQYFFFTSKIILPFALSFILLMEYLNKLHLLILKAL